MARLLIEDVTLVRSPEQATAHIRFKGGANQTIQFRCGDEAPIRKEWSWRNDSRPIIMTTHPSPVFQTRRESEPHAERIPR